jgi:hypothetical protein
MTRINFHAPEQIEREIRARGDLSESLRESLNRYFYLLNRGRSELLGVFDADELTALCTIGNGTIFEPHSIEGLMWNIEDAIPGTEIELTNKQKTALVAKLKAMPLHQHAALVDAVERFWRAVGTGMQVDPRSILP